MTFNERIGKFLGDLAVFTWYCLVAGLGLLLYFLVKVIISLLLLVLIPFGTIEEIFRAMIGKKGVGILGMSRSIFKEIGQVWAHRIFK